MSHDDYLDDDDYDLRIRRTPEDHTSAQLAHWGGFFTGPLIPLILYLVQQDKGSFVAWHAREALNFQITWTIYYGLACVPMCFFMLEPWLLGVGLVFVLLLAMAELWLLIAASLAVARGERYRYPLTFSFVPRPLDPREDNPYVDRE